MDAIIFMGVSGCGKSSYAARFAQARGLDFIESDDLHDAAAIAKMAAAIPLTDEDRWPWLDRLAARIEEVDRPAIGTCSALKRSYRDRLRDLVGGRLGFVHIDVPRSELVRRLTQRKGHFMPVALLDSQLAILERPECEPDTLTIHAHDADWQRRVDAWLGR